MNFIYVLVYGSEWDDTCIFLSKDDAIKESIKYPNYRIEIFSNNINSSKWKPTYNYYQNGEYKYNNNNNKAKLP